MKRILCLTLLLVLYLNSKVESSTGQSASRVNTIQAQYNFIDPFFGVVTVNPADPIQPPVIRTIPFSRVIDSLHKHFMAWSDSVNYGPIMTESKAESAIYAIDQGLQDLQDEINSLPGPIDTAAMLAPYLRSAIASTIYYPISNPNGYINSVPAQSFASLTGKPTTLSGYGITDAYPISGNPSNFLTSVPAQTWASITGKPTFSTVATSGDYNDLSNKPTIPAAQVNSDWNSVSGASQILNKPTLFSGSYTDLTNKPTLGTAASQNSTSFATAAQGALAQTALQAEVDGSVTNEIELPTQTGQSGKVLGTNGTTPSWVSASSGTVTSVGITSTDFSISGSPVTSSGNITANLNNSGISAGTYRSLTVDTKGRATAGTNPTISAATRSLNTGFQVSTTLNARVSYTVSLGTAVNLLNLNSAAQVYLETSPNNSTWTTVNAAGKTQALSVAITLGITETNLYNLQCEVLAGYWVRLRSVVSGGGTAAYSSGQETTY